MKQILLSQARKRPKMRSKLRQNESKQPKTSPNNPKWDQVIQNNLKRAKKDLNWPSTSQNKSKQPKRPKIRSKMTQNKTKQPKTILHKIQTDRKRAKTTQKNPK